MFSSLNARHLTLCGEGKGWGNAALEIAAISQSAHLAI
ncbi:hypothetical protein CHELA20_53589 [Hyphomicrobiales bacterium]|nr:hypothetical protein CHELA20_53589 [Hyphomicrobiales bacterium]